MRHKFLVIQLKVQEVHKGHITNPGICKPLSKIRNEGQALLIEKPCYAILASDFQINMLNTSPNVIVSVALIVAFFHVHKFTPYVFISVVHIVP